MKPGEMKIFKALTNNPEGFSFTDLKEDVNLSPPVLSEYLTKMQLSGVIIKNAKTRRYTLAQIYFPLETLPNDYQKSLKIFGVAIMKKSQQISKMKESEEKALAFKKFLAATFQYFTVIIWKVIGEAIAVYGDKQKNVKDQRLTLQMDAVVNQAFKDWVNPIASCIAVSISLNLNLIDVAEQFFGEALKEATRKLDGI